MSPSSSASMIARSRRCAWRSTSTEPPRSNAIDDPFGQRAVDDAIQLIGGQGVLADHPVDRLYRAVRALRIYEGTTEIQQLIIAGELLK